MKRLSIYINHVGEVGINEMKLVNDLIEASSKVKDLSTKIFFTLINSSDSISFKPDSGVVINSLTFENIVYSNPLNKYVNFYPPRLDDSNPDYVIFIDDDFIVSSKTKLYKALELAVDAMNRNENLVYIRFDESYKDGNVGLVDYYSPRIGMFNGIMLRALKSGDYIPDELKDSSYILRDVVMILSVMNAHKDCFSTAAIFNHGLVNNGVGKNNPINYKNYIPEEILNYISSIVDLPEIGSVINKERTYYDTEMDNEMQSVISAFINRSRYKGDRY